ncbi:MAG: AraC family transcriptional regulator [bacterium]
MTQTPNLVTETPLREASLRPSESVLAEALRMVRLDGAVYLRGDFQAPWGFVTPDGPELAEYLRPGTSQLVIFHAVMEGSCEIVIDSGETVLAEAGEIVILPFGNEHWLKSPGCPLRVPVAELLPPPPWANLDVVQAGEPEGEHTRMLCSYLVCNDILFNPLLRALPPVLKIQPTPGPAADWLRASLAYSIELTPQALAQDALGSRLPELLLVETLRHYLQQRPGEGSRWLGALADPIVGDALLRIHGDPARPWTVAELAEELGVSRSALAARFTEQLGDSPMRYLAGWRRQLASHLLQTTDLAISAIASRVGYDSEPAFSRAFKRSAGVAPGAWRTAGRSRGAAADEQLLSA